MKGNVVLILAECLAITVLLCMIYGGAIYLWYNAPWVYDLMTDSCGYRFWESLYGVHEC